MRARLLLNEAYAAPWCVSVPSSEHLVRLIEAAPADRLVPFHLVQRGAFELTRAGRRAALVRSGEGLFVTSTAEHRLAEGPATSVMPLERILRERRRTREEAASTVLICGVFVMHDVRFNPLFDALPDVLRIAFAGPGASPTSQGVGELLVHELSVQPGGRPWVIGRLLELLFAEAILSSSSSLGARRGWLRALHDQPIGTALSAFHLAPGSNWSVPRLASKAFLSPSRFAARFRQHLGTSPMDYVTRWRMVLAARQLSETSERVEQIGLSTGYDSLAAFSRAFKRQWGMSPLAMRKREGRSS